MTSPALSFLDLVPVIAGGTIAQALRNAAEVARCAEEAGYARYWVAEHHGMPGVGGAATSVVLAHIGAATSRIRIGAGGIMLPNHAPLQIAEQFGTLDALYPGRIDLGLGRAPGSEGRVAMALRRGLGGSSDNFVQDVLELQAMFAGDPQLGFTATPGAGAAPQVWILGSGLFGAQLAAAMGLPYAFAAHFAPALLDQAAATYREAFRPSAAYARPHLMVACNVCAADSAEEAAFLASSMQQAFVALRTGQGGKGFPAPVEGYLDKLPDAAKAMLGETMRISATGTQAMVREQLAAIAARSGADELIVTSQIYDHSARLHSIRIAAAAMAEAMADVAAVPA